MDHVDLSVEEDALGAIADKALAQKTGARGLRTIIEELLLDTMFDVPGGNVEKCIITKDTVENGSSPVIIPALRPEKRAKAALPSSGDALAQNDAG